MGNPFQKATKRKAFLRMALFGPSGSGKTYSALNIAQHLGSKIALVDTEHGSASKYADLFEFDVVELDNFAPRNYVAMIKAAQEAGYDVLIIDSLTHAWSGEGGVLEIVDKATARSKSKNSYAAWREGTPEHNALIDAMLASNLHLIATMRSKTEYVLEVDSRTKKTAPRKVGLAPIQRDGMEYEFDVVAEMDIDNTLIVSKSRCPALHAAVVEKPGQEIAEKLRFWLSDGKETPAPPKPKTKPQPQPAPESELDEVTWTRDQARLSKMLDYAEGHWQIVRPHAIRRLAKALGVELAGGDFPAFCAAMRDYEGTREDAVVAIKAYKSQGTNGDKPGQGAMCEACGENEADTDNPEDPTLCPACATLKADAEAQQQELMAEAPKKKRGRATKEAIAQ